MLKHIRHWLLLRRLGHLEIIEYPSDFKYQLKKLWQGPEPPEVTKSQAESVSADAELADFINGPRFSRTRGTPLKWRIAFTGGFTKAIATADRSMQGRILMALADISSEPTTTRGDTVKALNDDKKGQWRYRLGEYRLVYEPLIEEKMVVLIDFAPRGNIYE